MAVKAPNYTDEQTAQLKNLYAEGKTVDEIAELMGRARRSVISKLAREGVYEAPTVAPKAAKDEGPTKKELLATLRNMAPEIPSEGIQNATKEALTALIARLRNEPIEEAEEEEEEDLAA